MKYKDYWVKYLGVGDPPENNPSIGYCTQIAVFRMHTKKYKEVVRPEKFQRRLQELEACPLKLDYQSYFNRDEEVDLKPYHLVRQKLRNFGTKLEFGSNPFHVQYFDAKYQVELSESREQCLEIECYDQCQKQINDQALEPVFDETWMRQGVWVNFGDFLANKYISRYLKDKTDVG